MENLRLQENYIFICEKKGRARRVSLMASSYNRAKYKLLRFGFTPRQIIYKSAEHLYKNNDFKSAIEELNDIIMLHPASSKALVLRAKAYEALCNFEQAIEDCKKALELVYTLHDLPSNKQVYAERKSKKINDLLARCEIKKEFSEIFPLFNSVQHTFN